MDTASEEYTFTSFSYLPFYTQVNVRLLDLAEVGKQRTIVDLGCGTGGVTKLILERVPFFPFWTRSQGDLFYSF